MKKKSFKTLSYSIKYFLLMIIFHYIGSVIGVGSLYSYSLFIIPVLNYLALMWTVIRPLEAEDEIEKKDIAIGFIIITSVLNICFFAFAKFDYIAILVILFSNIIEFIIMKPKK
jgi:hypothetical protein